MRQCIYAKQIGGPCEGTVYSRQILCEMGMENTCLQRCSETCQYYEPVSQKMIDLKSGEILEIRQERIDKVISEGDGVAKSNSQPREVITQPVSQGGCCGGCNGTVHSYASKGGGYTNN